jgi:hypothetical protein
VAKQAHAMAAHKLPAPPSAPNEQRLQEDWSEDQYKNALAHLEKLQDQVMLSCAFVARAPI